MYQCTIQAFAQRVVISTNLHAHYAVIVQALLCHHTFLLSRESSQHLMYSCMKMRECLGAVWQLLLGIIIVPSCHSSFRLCGLLPFSQSARFQLV